MTTNEGDASVFDRPMLERLARRTIRTSTAWTDGEKTFEGVLAREVLAMVGAQGSTFTLSLPRDLPFRTSSFA
ncbi:hypothetical protein QNA08_17995 [Chelatococcus sp. SYSU_G07232]|uniref:Uncharacterized protein n=1 Tax=Chelatococcus albus TaxID=3047466 RepID=A0ABT7AL48_9HYPH|nr:hypothetical protein [Chelatococcus sp. SYSU_G07232]MDJ1160107.1 hypothetical protein [Chelatococcus sp. SYSU_G07232]